MSRPTPGPSSPGSTSGLLRRSVIHDMLRRRAARTPHQPAVIERQPSGGRREFSYAALDRAANVVAGRLLADGLRPGSVVAAIHPAGIEYVVAYYATLRCGATFTGFSPTATQSELTHLLSRSKPATVLVAEDEVDRIATLLGADLTPALVPMRGLVDGATVPDDRGLVAEPVVDVDEDDIAMIVFTSGTESRPKGVMITHRAFMTATTFSWVVEGYLRWWDRFLVLAPMHTMAGLGTVTNIITTGATVVFAGSTDVEVVLGCIEEERVTNMSQTPAFYRRLLAAPDLDRRGLASLQQCHTYGGLAQASVFERMSDAVPGMTWATYWGQTELSQLGSIGFFRTTDDIPSGDARWVGRATPHLDIRVVDESDRDVEVGELIVRSPAVMAGYLGDPAATDAALRDGWLRTGDIMAIDGDRNLFFHDRRKDMVKTGGMNVSTLEVEQVLGSHPAVAEVAVVGLPDAEWSEAVTAFVVPTADADVGPDELRAHCRVVLSPYKVPKSIRLVAALPRDGQGKVRKRELRRLGGEQR